MQTIMATTILRIASVCMLAFAFIWATAPYDPINVPAIWLIDLVDWPLDGNPSSFDRNDQWFSAVASSFLAGFALLFLLLVCPLIEQGNKLARDAALTSLGLWFIMDCLGSYAAGVPINIIWNIVLVLPFAVPLATVKINE